MESESIFLSRISLPPELKTLHSPFPSRRHSHNAHSQKHLSGEWGVGTSMGLLPLVKAIAVSVCKQERGRGGGGVEQVFVDYFSVS